MATGEDTVCISSNGISLKSLQITFLCLDSFTTWRRVFIKRGRYPIHRTLHEAFGARHPSSVTPRWGAPASPRGKPRGLVRIRLGAFRLVFCVPRLTPPARCAVLSFALSSCTPFYEWLHLLNLSGAVKLGSPVGELSSVSETEGVSFVEWELLKVPDCTPFAAARSTTPRCMIATGNHCYLDSLRGAPPPKGAARGAVSSFWLRGRRRCSILPGTGRPAGGSRRFAGPSSPRCCAGPGGRRCRRCPAA